MPQPKTRLSLPPDLHRELAAEIPRVFWTERVLPPAAILGIQADFFGSPQHCCFVRAFLGGGSSAGASADRRGEPRDARA